ncbi:helix-turn-helix domain-containing protein [Streptomyces sp. NPDC008150]|uniref:helix-turn-helix domain-containing protein n=1 Tax=Streptomyces sp. NPDC008150 TaxID=3364816 RepID=UPI0036E1DC8F
MTRTAELDTERDAGTGTGTDGLLRLGVHVRGRAVVLRGDDEIVLAPGDLVFRGRPEADPLRLAPDARMTFVRVPRACLGATDAELDRLAGCHVPGGEGVGALVSAFLTSLAAEDEELRRSRVGELLARNAVDLVAVLVTQLLDGMPRVAGSREGDGAAALLARVRVFVEEHLADPDLSPETIARAHHISVRHLHKLFQGEGVTVGRWIRSRRLESCRRDLGGPAGRRPTVAAVAHRWGFTSPSHFSRAFRDAYGMSPRAWQERAAAGLRTPAGPAGSGLAARITPAE